MAEGAAEDANDDEEEDKGRPGGGELSLSPSSLPHEPTSPGSAAAGFSERQTVLNRAHQDCVRRWS